MSVDIMKNTKEEIVLLYLKELKEELGMFYGSIIDVMENRFKKLMLSEEKIGNSIDELNLSKEEKEFIAIYPEISEKIFVFIKVKQEKILNTKTMEELVQLKGKIEKERQESGKINVAVVSATAGFSGLGLEVGSIQKMYKLKETNRIKNIEISDPKLFAEKMRKNFIDIALDLESSIQNPKLVPLQRQNLMVSAAEFRTIANQIDEGAITSMQMLEQLDGKLPISVLKNITPEQADKLRKVLSKNDDFFIKFRNCVPGEEIKLLEKYGIKGLNDDIIKVLKTADDVGQMKGMVHVMKNKKGTFAFLRGMKGVLIVDLIATGINVRILFNDLDEAESYKKINELRYDMDKERAWLKFSSITILSAAEIIALYAYFGASFGGWIGAIVGLAAGAFIWAVDTAIDVYYDAVNFYIQTPYELNMQYRSELKQGLISSAASDEWDFNINKRLTAIKKKAGYSWRRRRLPFGIKLTEKHNLTTTEDIWKSLIWQEECMNNAYYLIVAGSKSGKTEDDFKLTLNASELKEFEKQENEINAIVNKRMEYVRKFMDSKNKSSVEYKAFVGAMKNSQGIEAVEWILANSKLYYDMLNTGPNQYVVGCTSIEEYKAQYMKKLQSDNGKRFEELEKIYNNDYKRFLELYYGIKIYKKNVFDNNRYYEYDGKRNIIEKRFDFIDRYYEYKMLGVPIEKKQKDREVLGDSIDLNQIENLLISGTFDGNILNVNNFTAKMYFTTLDYTKRIDSNIQVSDRVGQNIIYRMAREIHGYMGNNDMNELIPFFSSDKANALGLYYDKGWIVNNDRAVDRRINIDDFEKMTKEEILKERLQSHWFNHVLNVVIDPSPIKTPGYTLFGFVDDPAMIDTKAEAGDMDKKMNEEYRYRLKKIIYEEKSYNEPETKKAIEEDVIEYIKTNSIKISESVYYNDQGERVESGKKIQGYVEIPYYLVVKAKKAGIGDLRKYLFKYENGQIVACTIRLYLDEKPDFSQTKTKIKKEYISGTTEILDETMKKYLQDVDEAKDKFIRLITFEGGLSPSLGIPTEYLKIYREKITEREMFKDSLSILSPHVATYTLRESYKSYLDYFENTYLAMLIMISQGNRNFKKSEHHQRIEQYVFSLKFINIDGKGNISGLESILDEYQISIFIEVFSQQKIDGKFIVDLARSNQMKDKEKANRALKQMIISFFEGWTLLFHKDDILSISKNRIESIIDLKMVSESEQRSVSLKIKKKINKEEEKKIICIDLFKKRIEKNLDTSRYLDMFDNELIAKKPYNYDKIQIKTMTDDQINTTKTAGEIQRIIEDTKTKDVYIQRGNILFNPETNMLKSYGLEIEIDIEKLTISGYDRKFKTLQELVFAANLINRFRVKYPGQKRFYFGKGLTLGLRRGIYNKNGYTRVVSLDFFKNNIPSLLDSKNNVIESFVAFINTST